ncbi:MAG: LLM class F420-dependent oxidoreductase [Acidimicrobiales bacterium]|nr:LLM class F420-dependent oxidoreductase [Acidimicrobiales bacterium]
MRFVFHYPETRGSEGDMLDSGELAGVARAAEAAGFDALALTEHPVPGARWLENGGHQSLDPFVALGFAAAATDRLRLLTHLALAPYRNPFLLAKAAATVDKLSGGRFILGLGAGYQKSEFFALGVSLDERGALFDEVLDCLPLHWSGEPFSYQGLHFDARDVVALPRPVQDPIPIWIGGNSKAARRRVVERASGWMPMIGSAELARTANTSTLASIDDVAVAIAELEAEAERVGRTAPIDHLTSYSDPGLASPEADVERHRHELGRIEEAGVTHVLVSHDRAEPAIVLDWLAAFGATYIS